MIKKRNLFAFAVVFMAGAILLCGALSYPFQAEATTQYTSGYYTYTVDENGNATIVNCGSAISGDVEVPSVLDGYSVIGIGKYAFMSCHDIISVTIPESVASIGERAFYNSANITKIVVDDDNSYYSSDSSGVLFNKDKTTLIKYPVGNERTSYIIPDGVTRICDCAFENCSLTSITIPDSVTFIGDRAFSSDGFTSIFIPDSVTSIGEEAFSNCRHLEKITVDAANANYSSDSDGVLFNKDKTVLIQYPVGNERTSYTIPDGVTSIGKSAFVFCFNLTSITLPDSVTDIGDDAFTYCEHLTDITLPDNLTTIGMGAFSHCDELTSITIPESVINIGHAAFYWCDALADITLPDSIISISNQVFEGTAYYNDDSNWENGVLYIGNHLIAAKSDIVSFEVKSGTKSIVTDAFNGCTMLETITIPIGEMMISHYVFDDCSNLKAVYFPGTPEQWEDVTLGSGNYYLTLNLIFECNSEKPYYLTGACGESLDYVLYTDGELVISGEGEMKDYYSNNDNMPWRYYSSKITTVTISEGVTGISQLAFEDCTNLLNITISDSVTSIGGFAFSNTAYYNDESNWENGVLYIENNLIKADSNVVSASYEVREGTRIIADSAFVCCENLESVTIPDSVISIGVFSFDECKNLKNVTISDNIAKIEYGAFNLCSGITAVYFPGTPEQWNSVTVEICNESLTDNLVFECNSDRPYYAKGICGDSLSYVLYADGELIITGEGEMYDCSQENTLWHNKRSKIKTVSLSNGITSIGESAFSSCNGLTIINIPDGVTVIGDGAFSYCSGLTSINIPDGVTIIGDGAFSYCSGLMNIEIPNSVNSIGEAAFSSCNGLTIINIPDGVTVIGDGAFSYCSGLTSINIPDSVTIIGDYAFFYCSGLLNIEIPNSVNSIGEAAFYGCSGLTQISIGSGVSEVGLGVFYGCSNLSNIAVHEENNYYSDINGVLFSKDKTKLICYPLGNTQTQYTIPSGVTNILDYAFYGSQTLTSITAADSVTSIGVGAFMNCIYLSNITLSDRVTTIGDEAFVMCYSISSIDIPDSLKNIGNYAFYGCISLSDVNYYGASEEWETISIGEYNHELLNANLNIMCKMVQSNSVIATYPNNCFNNTEVKLSAVNLGGSDDIVSGGVYEMDGMRRIGLYNIKMIDENSNIVQPENGKVKIKLPFPSEADSEATIEIYHLFSDGGREKFTTKPAAATDKLLNIVDGYLVFEVEHFSEFVIYVEENEPAEKTVSSISIASLPSKTSYTYKTENLDLSGLALTVTYSDGTTETITDTSTMKVTGFDSGKTGTQNVSVEYEGCAAKFDVTVSYAWWQWIIRILFLGFLWY